MYVPHILADILLGEVLLGDGGGVVMLPEFVQVKVDEGKGGLAKFIGDLHKYTNRQGKDFIRCVRPLWTSRVRISFYKPHKIRHLPFTKHLASNNILYLQYKQHQAP